ncbi:hypothetical protein JI435_432210 [Parastagonospora nodorum SN15]|uniref:Uncharacterized protein n=1 Tax=Phaeosphaeria nodorum (strain SN15 / ATCC MYA-4574 / FGSC 10173) TaxID=321614 RepID=A0A7U2F2P6_PHANO|nr:hypothetical protein HBH53_026900 [Parastagonospora nodorum]QRC95374.1 hypothetical protein JI435_432210 [Parastagonospora nodorum SN15]KAH4034767.1 hypothetical protein HBI09_103020 [Parastagonospora nodorum]KAH4059236.1 hypothetical protein HBH49_015640 [Parastagonospora nodorum]KAH4074693.1 hypothetical protein HBH50_028680 [Parastagonospora nodorum]
MAELGLPTATRRGQSSRHCDWHQGVTGDMRLVRTRSRGRQRPPSIKHDDALTRRVALSQPAAPLRPANVAPVALPPPSVLACQMSWTCRDSPVDMATLLG